MERARPVRFGVPVGAENEWTVWHHAGVGPPRVRISARGGEPRNGKYAGKHKILILLFNTYYFYFLVTLKDTCLKQKMKMSFWFIAYIEYITTVAQKPRVPILYVK